MNDDQFQKRVDSWNKRFEGICQDMTTCTNDDGEYPHIDFMPLQLAFQTIVTGMREGREPQSLILVPGSPRIITN